MVHPVILFVDKQIQCTFFYLLCTSTASVINFRYVPVQPRNIFIHLHHSLCHLIAKYINSFLNYITVSKHPVFVFIADSSRSRVVLSLSIISNGEVRKVEVDPFISLC